MGKAGWPLVMEKSGKSYFSSGSGKSQGILQNGQGNLKYRKKKRRVKSKNFLVLAQKCLAVAGILSILSD